MASKRPTTIAEYIRASPREGQPHLRRLYATLDPLLRRAAISVRFFRAESTPELRADSGEFGGISFRKELEKYKTTKGTLQCAVHLSAEPLRRHRA